MGKLDNGKKAKSDSLMNAAQRKREAASKQEGLGKAQIKNKVKPGQTGVSLYKETLGRPLPVGKERLDIAKNMRKSAMVDEYQAKKLMAPMTPKAKNPMPKPRSSKKK